MSDTPLCIERWTRDFAEDTKRHSLSAINRLSQLSGMEPESFLDFAKSHDGLDTFDIIRKARDTFEGSVAVNFENHIRSFLKHNGVRNLPTSKNTYSPKDWHRAYTRPELRNLLSYIPKKHNKLFALIAIESGLRAQAILDIRYRHIQQDLEGGLVPVAIRLEPGFYNGSKSAGFTFLGQRSVALLREMIKERLVKKKPTSRIVGVSYPNVQFAVKLAKKKARIDPKVQPSHGFRKYFENALDRAGLDQDVKRVLEGHFGDTRSKHYTGREWDQLRDSYRKAYPFIDPEGEDSGLMEETKSELSDLHRRVKQLEEERIAWTDQFIKLLIEWSGGPKGDKTKVREFAKFLLEHGSVKKQD